MELTTKVVPSLFLFLKIDISRQKHNSAVNHNPINGIIVATVSYLRGRVNLLQRTTIGNYS